VCLSGSLCWDTLFDLVKHHGVTKLLLGDNGVTKNAFTDTSFPADVDKEPLERLEVLDLHGLDFLKGNGECMSCLKTNLACCF
jgi:hypothetical protein